MTLLTPTEVLALAPRERTALPWRPCPHCGLDLDGTLHSRNLAGVVVDGTRPEVVCAAQRARNAR